jgi:hypothetical protein
MIDPSDPQGVIDAAQLVVDEPAQISEGELQAALERVRQRKSSEHGRWREAEFAVLGALAQKRRQKQVA